jgi:hypothetical protein
MFFSIDTKKRRIHEMVSSVHEIPLYTHEMIFMILFRHLLGIYYTKCRNSDEKVLELSCFTLIALQGCNNKHISITPLQGYGGWGELFDRVKTLSFFLCSLQEYATLWLS